MDDAYIYAKCKCGRTVRGLKEYLKKGISCPDCGAFVKTRPQDNIQAQNETPEIVEESIENKPEETVTLTDKCPSCNATVTIDYKKKYLAYCTVCSKMFIRSQKPEPEDATDGDSKIGNNAKEADKNQEKNTLAEGMSGKMQGNAEAMVAVVSENVDKNISSGSVEPQSAQEIKAPQNQEKTQTSNNPESQTIQPSEKQIKLLRFLDIGGITESSNELSNIILTITSVVDDAVREYYMCFHLFPPEVKTEIIYNIIKSPFFPGIYFGDRDIKYEELQPIIDDVVRDTELRKAMKIYVPDESFILAQKYISGFCDYVFNAPVDPDTLKILTLKSFVRGFGPKLQPFANVLYDNKAVTRNLSEQEKHADNEAVVTRKISEQEKHNYRIFFKKKTSTNSSLEILLNEYGLRRPAKKAESAFGCLIYFTPLFLPVILYFVM